MDKHMEKMLDYYRIHGLITEPREYTPLLKVIPDSLEEIVKVVQGLFLHIFWAKRYGVTLTKEQMGHVQTRYVSDMLALIQQIDDSPLNIARPLEKRFIGNCRDFSVFLTAVLRSKGIPARARCGFGRYFIPGKFEDHWICEYWNESEERWIGVDAQLDDLQKNVLQITFDTLNITDQFMSGGKAWQLARSGHENPDDFGIMDMHGLWFIRGDMLRDLAALNKVELLPWDCWGLMNKADDQITTEEYALLDHLADHLVRDESIFELYQQEGLTVPAVIDSFTQNGVLKVTLK